MKKKRATDVYKKYESCFFVKNQAIIWISSNSLFMVQTKSKPDCLNALYTVQMHSAHQGTTNLTFVKKIKNSDPLMGAKVKSKTQFLTTFFLFLVPFFARLTSKFEKSTNMT